MKGCRVPKKTMGTYYLILSHLFTQNLEVHNHGTRSANDSHVPFTRLTKYQKRAHYVGIKIFNLLSSVIKSVVNEIQVFKKTFKRFLLDNLFYSVDEHFSSNKSNVFQILIV